MTEAIHPHAIPVDLSAARVQQISQKQQRSEQQNAQQRYGAASQQTTGQPSAPSEASQQGTATDIPRSSSAYQDQVEISAEAKMLQQLSQRDREVRAHEAAHAAVGGQYAGAPSYTYQRGPDGKQYAIGGEVQIDVSEVAGDPEATIEKMQQVKRAAMAPANPSSADRQIAARASRVEVEARAELSEEEMNRLNDPEEASATDTEGSVDAVDEETAISSDEPLES